MVVKKVPVTFDPVGEYEQSLYKELISKYHTHLVNVNVALLFMNKEIPEDEKKKQYTTVSKVTGKVKAICNVDFLVTIHWQLWCNLSDDHKRIVLDHALSHLWVEETDSGDVKLKILKHDFEEFTHILGRYKESDFFDRLTTVV